jgi:hypothetical protein
MRPPVEDVHHLILFAVSGRPYADKPRVAGAGYGEIHWSFPLVAVP